MNQIHSLGTSLDWIVIVIYFIAILLFGSYFGKYNSDTNDFFFGGSGFPAAMVSRLKATPTRVTLHCRNDGAARSNLVLYEK